MALATRQRQQLELGGMLITMDTPNILVGTSRGVVPHLSRDHTHGSDAIQWLHVPFESL
ncbi:hypothetical protein JVT61DRAFT_10124 [Boletus reticuloceps]|uniref:Uncharacterized protein n=1 Tax=Boletus reticuloceps TaxID=495285 RepID=A0A8I2YVZ8_9AGAM|nr:hypothetical protein JVT61DRAFT_10124 [Boletus reticuloceps]